MNIFTHIKERVTLLNVLQRLAIDSNTRGQIHCPFHEDNKESCSVHESFFKCHACGTGGDAITFWAKKHDLDPYSAAIDLANQFGIKLKQGNNSPPHSFDYRSLWPYSAANIEVYSYIGTSSCFLTDEVRYTPKNSKKKRSIFVCHNLDSLRFGWTAGEYYFEPANSTWKRIDKSKRTLPGSSTKEFSDVEFPLYREDLIRNNLKATVLFTEGPKDANTLNELGFIATTVAGGANGKIRDIHTEPLANRDVIILPDNEAVGIQAAKRRKQSLLPICRSVKIIPPFKINKGSDVSDQVDRERKKKKLDSVIAKELLYIFNNTKLDEKDGSGLLPFATDDANASRFADAYAGKLVYVSNEWYTWNGSKYILDETNTFLLYAREEARKLIYEASLEEDSKAGEAKFKHAIKSLSSASLKSVIFLSRSDKHIAKHTDEFDRNPHEINLLNGIFNLSSGRFFPHSSGNYPLVMNCCDTEFDKNSKCPGWQRALSDTMITKEGETSNELIEFFQVVIGSALLGEVQDKKFYVCFGPGDDGKSITLWTISSVLGDYGYPFNFDALVKNRFEKDANPDLAGLRNKRFAWAMESEAGAILNEGKLNLITGGDPLTFRMLNQNPVTFVPSHTIFLGTSNMPRAVAKDRGFWGRFCKIPFNAYFTSSPDHANPTHKKLIPLSTLKSQLAKEKPGILNWMLEGCSRYLSDGLVIPEIVANATGEFKESQDPLREWIEDRIDICIGDDVYTSVAGLWNDYRSWHRDCGNSCKLLTKAEYDIRLPISIPGVRLATKGRRSDIRAWDGIALKLDGINVRGPVF